MPSRSYTKWQVVNVNQDTLERRTDVQIWPVTLRQGIVLYSTVVRRAVENL
jgi:hypothetical protein